MSLAQRLKIFAVGFAVGMVILFIILSKKQGDRIELTAPPTAEDVQLEAVPGVLDAYRDRRVAMESKFIAEQHRTPQPDGTWKRLLLIRGMDPEQVLRIEEYTHEDSGIDLVDRVVVTAPDRLLVNLAKDVSPHQLAAEIHPLGYRVLAKTDDGEGVIVGLGEASLKGYAEAVERLEAMPVLVVAVEPVVYGEVEPFAQDAQQ
ncbi:MAG: hypothetical protein Q7Q73_06040 [Verrucomicrobiota bacterium JB024]|nr:hypothetical protein [Verrucomicrobiota bacterium JB024]